MGLHKLLNVSNHFFFGGLGLMAAIYLIGRFLYMAGKRCVGIPLDRGRCWNPDHGRKPSDRLFEATLSLLRRVPDGRRPDAVQPAPFLPGLRKNAG